MSCSGCFNCFSHSVYLYQYSLPVCGSDQGTQRPCSLLHETKQNCVQPRVYDGAVCTFLLHSILCDFICKSCYHHKNILYKSRSWSTNSKYSNNKYDYFTGCCIPCISYSYISHHIFQLWRNCYVHWFSPRSEGFIVLSVQHGGSLYDVSQLWHQLLLVHSGAKIQERIAAHVPGLGCVSVWQQIESF